MTKEFLEIPVHLGNGMVKKLCEIDNSYENFKIEHIAHCLSNSCRYNGSTPRFYSVLEHSLIVAKLAPEEYKLSALLHDAPEAYVGDLISPLKKLESLKGYKEIESYFEGLMQEALAYNKPLNFAHPEVKKADVLTTALEIATFWGIEAVERFGIKGVDISTDMLEHILPKIPSAEPSKTKLIKEFVALYEELTVGKAKEDFNEVYRARA